MTSTDLTLSRFTLAATLAYVAWTFLAESTLAPVRPGGSWLILKALPLLALFPGLWRGQNKASQWLSLLILVYMAESIVRAFSDPVPIRVFGWIAVGLTSLIFGLSLVVAGRAKKRFKAEIQASTSRPR